MLLLPSVKKGFKRALTRVEKAQKVIAAVALGLGIGLAILPANEAQATPAEQSVKQPVGSLIFAFPSESEDLAKHYSHRSHASHRSHYSSR